METGLLSARPGHLCFKHSVSDPPYRSQLGQHGTALVQLTLIVYSVPGGLPQQMVLVSFSDKQRHTLLSLQQLLAERYLQCFFAT